MLSFLKTKKSSAVIRDGALVVALYNGTAPVLWKASVEDIKACSFLIEKRGSDVYVLTMSDEKKKTDIATFDDDDDAEQAMALITRAMMVGGVDGSETGNGFFTYLLGFLAVFVVLYLVVTVFFFYPDDTTNTSAVSSSTQPMATQQLVLPQGEIVVLDDVLKNTQEP